MKPIITPGLLDVLTALKTEIFSTLNCVKIGKITKFDQTKKTAEIQILFKRVTQDHVLSYPILVDCPIFTLQGGGGSLRMPVQTGDTCIVLFADRNIDIWFSNGAEAAPANSRCHDLSDGIAIVGLNAQNGTLADYDTNVNLTLPTDKKLVVTGAGTATAEILGTAALALLSELTTLNNWCKTHTHSGVTTGPGVSGVPAALPTPDPVGTTKLKGA
jgi:hypothetical protein